MKNESPSEDAYGRVTNPERFFPLHPAMLEILERLGEEFDVRREEGYALDKELERDIPLARSSVRLTPSDPDAAPVAVSFTDLPHPGLRLRFGLWWTEPYPDCMCDACDPDVDGVIEDLEELLEDITNGLYWESRDPRWSAHGIWGKRSGRSRNLGATVDWSQQRQLVWKPWPRRGQHRL